MAAKRVVDEDEIRQSPCLTGDPANSIGKILYELYITRLTATRAAYLDELNAAALAQGAGSVASNAQVDSLVRAVADIVRSGGSGDLAAILADVTGLNGDAMLTAANVWETNISAYSGAGYAGTYLKTLYDDWLNGGRLDLLLDACSTHSAADVMNVNISAYSTAGYAGTYIKTLYDDWLNGGRLDLLLDACSIHNAGDVLDVDISAYSGAGYAGTYLKSLYDKKPSKTYLMGSADADGGFDSEAKADMQAECTSAIAADDLDHLLELDGATQKYPENCATDSVIAKMIAKGDPATPSTYDNATDSLEAISDYVRYAREMIRAHAQARIGLIVPDLSNIGSDTTNAAIFTLLNEISTANYIDQTEIDNGEQNWLEYNLLIVGSDANYAFTTSNLDDLVTMKIPIIAVSSAVAIFMKMGHNGVADTGSVTNIYVETIGNRIMASAFGATGDQTIFSAGSVSSRIDMSDAQLSENLLATVGGGAGGTNAETVVGDMPYTDGSGTIYTLDDGTELPSGRFFAGCFLHANNLSSDGEEFFKLICRNIIQSTTTVSLELKANAAKVNRIWGETYAAGLAQAAGSVASNAQLDSLVRAVADIVRSGGSGDLAAILADVTGLNGDAMLTAANVWETNISAYSGAGYAGTYLKTLYDDWLNGGRLDLILDNIESLVDSAEVAGPYSYTDAGGEQTVKEDTAVTRRHIHFEVSNRNMTQTGTFKLYRKVDGSNYDLYTSQAVKVAAGSDRAWDVEFTTNQAWKVTYEEDSDEGAARAIPYNVITQVIE